MRGRTATTTARLALAAIALAGLAGCGSKAAEDPPSRPPAGPSVAERVRVLNADVLVIDGHDTRLADAVAPQPLPDARCWAEALAAKQATAVVRALVRNAGAIRVAPTGRTDDYNRQIAHVWLDNQDLAATLHDLGLAAENSTGRFGWCEPVSAGGQQGAPDVKAFIDLSQN